MHHVPICPCVMVVISNFTVVLILIKLFINFCDKMFYFLNEFFSFFVRGGISLYLTVDYFYFALF